MTVQRSAFALAPVPTRLVLFTWGIVLVAITYGCVVGPKHPNNPGARDEVCSAICTKETGCGAARDATTCLNECRSRISRRIQYDRLDFIASIRACVDRTICGPNLGRRLVHDCIWETQVGLVPTPFARAVCERRLEKTTYCVTTTVSVDKCLEEWKMYSDAILGDLDECAGDRICSNYGRCLHAVVGPDAYWDDPDRAKEERQRPVPSAPPSRIRFEGVAGLNGTPWPGILVCANGHPEVLCSTTGTDGRFALLLPASSELTVTLGGTGVANVAIGVTTSTHDLVRWSLWSARADELAARYQDAGVSFPDPRSGSILVTLFGPRQVGAQGMTVSLSTPTAGRIVYMNRDGRPNPALTATSAAGRALVVAVAPGFAEVVVGPETAMCTPISGWAGQALNRVRVPIVAGRETRVALRCAP